jgi:cell filamentation protein
MTFKKSGRYSVPPDEDFEPGSNGEVLKNNVGIKFKGEMEALEENELEYAELELLNLFDENHQFTAEDICNIHELWLGDIYPFAGNYRSVNMAKGDFLFAPSNRIEYLMNKFESDFLAKYTPCHYADIDELANALGVVHVELILIHPFREGNGRVARLLADLMSMQAKKPPLNYIAIDQTENQHGFDQYILAIHAGVGGIYEPMKEIFKMLLDQSV